MAWKWAPLRSNGTAKTLSSADERGEKGTVYLGDGQHGRLVTKTHYANPHSTSSFLDRVAASRGFLP